MDSYKVLGVAQDTIEEEERKANKVLAMKWHSSDRRAEERDERSAKFADQPKMSKPMLKTARRRGGTPPFSVTNTAFVESPLSSPQASPTPRTRPLPKSDSTDSQNTAESSSSSHHFSPTFSSFGFSENSSPTSINSEYSQDDYLFRSSSPQDSTYSGPSAPSRAGSGNSMPRSNRLKKQSKAPSSIYSASDFTPKRTIPKRHDSVDSGSSAVEPCGAVTLRPGRAILSGAGGDSFKKWVHFLNMTLEELYEGKTFHFRILRYTQVGKKDIVPIDVHVPPGTRANQEITCQDVGHERRDGTHQEISFIVREKDHPRFTRNRDDLIMEVRLPWLDSLATDPGKVYVRSVDDQEYEFSIDYCKDHALAGTTVIQGAGMPCHPSGYGGRGKVIVRWEIAAPQSSSWDSFKSTLGFKNRGG